MKIAEILASITLVSLPLYVIRCSNFAWCSSPVPFTLIEVLILATFSYWLLWRVYQIKKGRTSLQRLAQSLSGPFLWPLTILVFLATFSLFISPDLTAAAGFWKAFFIEPAMLFLVVLDLSQTKKSVSWVVFPLILSGLLVSLVAIWQGASQAFRLDTDVFSLERVKSLYNSPNAIGLFVGPLFVLGLGVLLESLQKGKKSSKNFYKIVFLAVSLLAFIAAIYLSNSRGAFVGIGVSLVFFGFSVGAFYLKRGFKRILVWLLYLLIAAYFAITIFTFINIDNFAPKEPRPALDSFKSRLCIWQSSRKIISENPAGTGLASFPKVYSEFQTCESYAYPHSHNTLAEFWIQLGILGLLVFLLIIYMYEKILFRLFKYKSFFAVGMAAVAVYILVHGMVDVYYFKNDMSAQFWIFLAIATWMSKNENSFTN